MTYFPRHNRVFLLVIFCLTFSFAACSSGGKGKGSNNSDTTPDAFTLTAPTGVDLTKVSFSTPITSSPVTINGITGAAPVSISGGEFSVAGGAFASTARTVSNGQTVTVRVQSPAKAGKTATAVLSVGGQTATFAVTTDADITPPEVAILFPPPASMTEGQTLFLRGTVKDVHGTLAEGAVTVNGVEAELELNTAGDEGTWSVTLDLAVGDNTLIVTATDAAENVNDEESVSSRRVADISGESFPDNQNPFFSALKVDVGQFNDKLTAFVTDDSRDRPAVVAVDLTSGARTLVADNQGVEESLQFQELQSVLHNGANGKLYVSDFSSAIFELDLQNNTRRTIALAEEGSFLYRPKGMLLLDGKKLFVADRQRMYWINTETLEQTLFSSAVESVPDDQNSFEDGIWSLVFDVNRFYVAEWNNKIFSVDSVTGGRQVFAAFELPIGSVVDLVKSENENELIFLFSGVGEAAIYRLNLTSKASTVLSSSTEPSDINAPIESWGIASYTGLGYLVLIDRDQKAVMGVDLETGVRVIISKSVTQQ